MKGMRFVSYFVGLTATGLTIFQIIQSINRINQTDIPWNRFIVWEWVYLWLDWIVSRIALMLRKPTTIDIILLVVYLAALIVSIIQARMIRRSPWDWGILALIFPYLAALLLPFMPEKSYRRKSVIGQIVLAVAKRSRLQRVPVSVARIVVLIGVLNKNAETV